MNIPVRPGGQRCILHIVVVFLSLPSFLLYSSTSKTYSLAEFKSGGGGGGGGGVKGGVVDKAHNMLSARHITHLLLFYVLITTSAAADGRRIRM